MKYLNDYPELDLLAKALSFSSPTLRVSTRIEAYSCKAIKAERKLFKALEQDLVSDLALSTSISPPEHHPALVQSAFGPLDKRDSRKILWLLIATLNLAFPDHDFSRINPEEFVKEDSANGVLSSLSSALNHLRSNNSASDASSVYRSISSYPPGPSSSLPDHSLSKTNSKRGKATGPKGRVPGQLTGVALHDKLRDLSNSGGEAETPMHPLLRTVLEPIINLEDSEVFSYSPDLDSDPHAIMDEEEEYSTEEEGDDTRMLVDDYRSSTWNQSTSMPSTPLSESGPFRRHKRRNSAAFMNGRSSAARYEDNSFMMDEDLESFIPPTPNPGSSAGETGGLLWSSNHFFYNKKMKRILFISCWGRKLDNGLSLDEEPQTFRPLRPPVYSRASSVQRFRQPSLLARLGFAQNASSSALCTGEAPVLTVGSAPADFSYADAAVNPLLTPDLTTPANPPSPFTLAAGRGSPFSNIQPPQSTATSEAYTPPVTRSTTGRGRPRKRTRTASSGRTSRKRAAVKSI